MLQAPRHVTQAHSKPSGCKSEISGARRPEPAQARSLVLVAHLAAATIFLWKCWAEQDAQAAFVRRVFARSARSWNKRPFIIYIYIWSPSSARATKNCVAQASSPRRRGVAAIRAMTSPARTLFSALRSKRRVGFRGARGARLCVDVARSGEENGLFGAIRKGNNPFFWMPKLRYFLSAAGRTRALWNAIKAGLRALLWERAEFQSKLQFAR